MNPLKKKNVPWWIWVATAAALAIMVVPFTQKETRAVHIVGAGAIAALDAADAPEGHAFRLRTEATESIAETAVRFQKILEIRPAAVVVGFDTTQLEGEIALSGHQALVHAVVVAAERNPAPVYMLPFVPPLEADQDLTSRANEMNEWMTDEVCTRKKIRCVEMPAETRSERNAHRALRDVVRTALTTEPAPTPEAPEPTPVAEPQASL